jgi:hypothetical protein
MPRLAVPLAAVAVAACALQRPPSVILTPQHRIGLGDSYGPGIDSASSHWIRFEIAVPAHVIVLRVTDAGIEQVQPTSGPDYALQAGAHSMRGCRLTIGENRDVSGDAYTRACERIFKSDPLAKPVPSGVTTVESVFELSETGSSRRLADERGYWLLIVSDVPTPARQLEHWLGLINTEDDSLLVTTVLALPSLLVGGRTTNWTGYYVGFAPPIPVTVR